MYSLKNVAASAAVVQDAAKEAAKHLNIQNVAIPSANECREALTDGASTAADSAAKMASAHPFAATVISIGLLTVAAPAMIATPALAAAGFTAQGVTAASLASAAQAGIGNVIAGSTFATLQSAAAGGYGVAVVNGAIQGIGGAVAAVGAIGAWLGKSDKAEEEEDAVDEE